jgi:hypothetical protein
MPESQHDEESVTGPVAGKKKRPKTLARKQKDREKRRAQQKEQCIPPHRSEEAQERRRNEQSSRLDNKAFELLRAAFDDLNPGMSFLTLVSSQLTNIPFSDPFSGLQERLFHKNPIRCKGLAAKVERSSE